MFSVKSYLTNHTFGNKGKVITVQKRSAQTLLFPLFLTNQRSNSLHFTFIYLFHFCFKC